MECPGQELLGGSLRRAGLAVRDEELVTLIDLGVPCEPGAAVARVLSYLGRDGRAVGLCVVTRTGHEAKAAAGSLARWAAVMRTRRLLVAEEQPLCAGARRALGAVDRALESDGEPVFLLGGWADSTLTGSAARGATPVARAEAVPLGARVVIGPAGVPTQVQADLAARDLTVVDTVCPLAAAVQGEVRRFAEQGESVVLVGRSGHAALPALVGQAPEAVHLVESVEQARSIELADPGRVAVVVQPGLPVEEAELIAEAVRSRFGHVIPQHPSTYCYAASDRGRGLVELAASCGVVLVVGPEYTAPATVNVIERVGGAAYPVAAPGDILPAWLAGVACVGVTAAPGAAPGLVTEVLRALTGLGPCAVVARRTLTTAAPTGAAQDLVPAARSGTSQPAGHPANLASDSRRACGSEGTDAVQERTGMSVAPEPKQTGA